jgi:hypothetical protein
MYQNYSSKVTEMFDNFQYVADRPFNYYTVLLNTAHSYIRFCWYVAILLKYRNKTLGIGQEIEYYCCCYHLLSQVSFPLVLLLLNQWCTRPLGLQVSDYSTFLIMCDVPSTAAFCRETIECFPDIVSRYVAPMITSMTKHFVFHILWIYVLRFLYINFCHHYRRRRRRLDERLLASQEGLCSMALLL